MTRGHREGSPWADEALRKALLGNTEAAFSQGVLFDFLQRLIRTHMDGCLLDKSVEVAMSQRDFGWRALKSSLRVAIDSRPLA